MTVARRIADRAGSARGRWVLLLSPVLVLALAPVTALADLRAEIEGLAGADGAVYAVDDAGQVLVDVRGERAFRPASTLKVFTTLLAAEHLGMDSRFETRFWLDGDMLVVRGGGDPFLVSEELDLVAVALRERLGDRGLAGIAIDDSFFEEGIRIPGVGATEEPYDALNSATAVNFNTINVKVEGDRVSSAEDQTPLTPLAERAARRLGVRGTLRVNLSSDPREVRRYASELIAAKLRAAGVRVGDRIEERRAPGSEPLYVHGNSRTVREVCGALLYYSNNYVANQVFLAIGARVHGEPANLEKGVRVARAFIEAHPALQGFVVTEGSGISYENQVTGPSMAAALEMFAPYKDLLRVKDGTPSKTGTLTVAKSVVGYAETKTHGTVRFVILLDGGGANRRWEIVRLLRERL